MALETIFDSIGISSGRLRRSITVEIMPVAKNRIRSSSRER